MDKSTPRSRSRIFITSLQTFDLVYVVGEKQVVSRFRSGKSYPWSPATRPAGAAAPRQDTGDAAR